MQVEQIEATVSNIDNAVNNPTKLLKSYYQGAHSPALINKTIGNYLDNIVDNNPKSSSNSRSSSKHPLKL